MPDLVFFGLFVALAVSAVGCAVATVSSRRLGRVTLRLAATGLAVAGLALMSRADYLAAVILVLVGSVSALAIATGTPPASARERDSASWRAIAAAVLAVAAVGGAVAFVAASVGSVAMSAKPVEIAALGEAVFSHWPVPVALVASLLLSVLVGAAAGPGGEDE